MNRIENGRVRLSLVVLMAVLGCGFTPVSGQPPASTLPPEPVVSPYPPAPYVPVKAAEDTNQSSPPIAQARETTEPTKEVTYRLLLLIESDDNNRQAYDGPARQGLAKAGFGRLVIAGSAMSAMSIGQKSVVTGTSRYGSMSVSMSMMNTTDREELQVKVSLQTRHQSPMTIETIARAPMGRWFLVGAGETRAGIPLHAADGKRGVVVMKVDPGVALLD
ncbi:hypothetical protein [Roseiconus lacunae]|uniref:hypothetical protein n=1 Tax=Roseiconus lacunae TaxID=2605694 RepID=UPI0011F3B0DB|nr:hypothetical protein [Roseiconus lacunae]